MIKTSNISNNTIDISMLNSEYYHFINVINKTRPRTQKPQLAIHHEEGDLHFVGVEPVVERTNAFHSGPRAEVKS